MSSNSRHSDVSDGHESNTYSPDHEIVSSSFVQYADEIQDIDNSINSGVRIRMLAKRNNDNVPASTERTRNIAEVGNEIEDTNLKTLQQCLDKISKENEDLSHQLSCLSDLKVQGDNLEKQASGKVSAISQFSQVLPYRRL
jgi:hypothetical protein